MTEYIIRDDVLYSIQQTCFEAGKRRHEVFTVRGPGEEIVRCRDCKHCKSFVYKTLEMTDCVECYCCLHCTTDGEPLTVTPGCFCAWAERRGS